MCGIIGVVGFSAVNQTIYDEIKKNNNMITTILSDKRPIIKISINEKIAYALVDTGASLNLIDDNQLNGSNLTLEEIEKIIQAFLNTLQGAYHNRIKYPKLDEGSRKG